MGGGRLRIDDVSGWNEGGLVAGIQLAPRNATDPLLSSPFQGEGPGGAVAFCAWLRSSLLRSCGPLRRSRRALRRKRAHALLGDVAAEEAADEFAFVVETVGKIAAGLGE